MNILKIYDTLARFPLGKKLFSWLFCLKAPYFGTVKPCFEELKKGSCTVKIKKRRAVENHLGFVHAIAICNMAEAAAGLCVEATLPKALRWIPKRMEVDYLKKAATDLRAVCRFNPEILVPGEILIPVDVLDENNEVVFRAKITMYVSARKTD